MGVLARVLVGVVAVLIGTGLGMAAADGPSRVYVPLTLRNLNLGASPSPTQPPPTATQPAAQPTTTPSRTATAPSAQPTATRTSVPSCQSQDILSNGGFETGGSVLEPWGWYGDWRRATAYRRSGAYSAELLSGSAGRTHAQQLLTIPTGASGLTIWLSVRQKSVQSQSSVTVALLHPTTFATVYQATALTGADPWDIWHDRYTGATPIDVRAYRGQTLRLQVTAWHQKYVPGGSVWLDDLAVVASC